MTGGTKGALQVVERQRSSSDMDQPHSPSPSVAKDKKVSGPLNEYFQQFNYVYLIYICAYIQVLTELHPHTYYHLLQFYPKMLLWVHNFTIYSLLPV